MNNKSNNLNKPSRASCKSKKWQFRHSYSRLKLRQQRKMLRKVSGKPKRLELQLKGKSSKELRPRELLLRQRPSRKKSKG